MQSSIFEITVFGISIAPKWYGLMYALGFIICYQFTKKWGNIEQKKLDSLLLFIFFGVVGGGRIGYIILYNFSYYQENPANIFKVWEGGMSFHGGLLGVIFSLALFSKIHKKSFFSISDILAIIVPVAIGLGRIGNYINKELLGFSPYDGPFVIIKNGKSYFPSPLLEMFLEGIVLFLIMLYFAKKIGFFHKSMPLPKYREGLLSSIFLISYGVLRLIAEQFRLPDAQIGYLFDTDWMTLGILYSIPVILTGVILFRQKLSPR